MTNKEAIEKLKEISFMTGYKEDLDLAIKVLDEYEKGVSVLDKIRAEIEQKIEQERFARSIFRGEEKDAGKAEQCTGSIFAYNNVIKLIDKYRQKGGEEE